MVKKFFASILVSAMLLASMPAEAAYGGARSVSSTRVYSAPRSTFSVPSRPVYTAPRAPVYRAPYTPAPTVVNRTTVVNQRSGGGFFSSMFGSMAGTGVMMWLMGNHGQQPAAPAPAAVVPAVPASAPASAPVVTK